MCNTTFAYICASIHIYVLIYGRVFLAFCIACFGFSILNLHSSNMEGCICQLSEALMLHPTFYIRHVTSNGTLFAYDMLHFAILLNNRLAFCMLEKRSACLLHFRASIGPSLPHSDARTGSGNLSCMDGLVGRRWPRHSDARIVLAKGQSRFLIACF